MSLIYRLRQKLKYHFSSDLEGKRIIEINRLESIISTTRNEFKIKGLDLVFNQTHKFIFERFELFMFLVHIKKTSFEIVDNNLIYNIDSLKLRITTSEELFIIKEVFYETCYCLLTAHSLKVIDIGMNVGFSCLYFSANPNINQIFGFEPFKKTFDDAEYNFQLNPVQQKKILRYNLGLGSVDENLEIGYSKTLKGKNSILSNDTNLPIETITIKQGGVEISKIANENAKDKFLVKMDCEGAEFDIFENFKEGIIPNNIIAFIIEWHNRNPELIINHLLRNGFKIQKKGLDSIGILTAIR